MFLTAAAMAAVNRSQTLHKELICPICLDYFSDPVVLNCDHNFCRVCITTFWEDQDTSFSCPQCRKRSCKAKLRPNTQLGKVAERAKELASFPAQIQAPADQSSKAASKPETAKEMCKKHLEALKLFCLDDQILICLICVKSQEHRVHSVIPAEEAAEEYKMQLLHHLATLKSERNSQEILAVNRGKRLEMLVGHVEAERQRTVHTFQRLQKILQDRESHLLQGLSKVTHDLRKMQQENRTVQEGAPLLRDLVTEVEHMCQQPDTVLLKDVGTLLSRCQNWTFPKWAPASTTELEEKMFHFSRKRTLLWEHMTEMQEILTLDPDSAHPCLAISADLRTVSRKDDCPVYGNISRRFYPSFCVLGSEGFTSGRHHWLVDVKGRCGWALGVVQESVDRKKPVVLAPEHGVWAVELGPYQLFPAASASKPETDIPTRRILVSLDYEAGRVAFSNSRNSELLFTFRTSFSEKLYPFFWLWSPEASITLCPCDE